MAEIVQNNYFDFGDSLTSDRLKALKAKLFWPLSPDYSLVNSGAEPLVGRATPDCSRGSGTTRSTTHV
jgi:hypothetical protein